MARKIVELTEAQRARFDRCWEIYSRKINKGEAEIAWSQIDPDDELTEKIYGSILAQNRDRGTKRLSKDEKKFIKHFSSWLRAKGWVYESERDGEFATGNGKLMCKCGAEAVWTNGTETTCIKCYEVNVHPNFKREVYDNLCKHGLGKLKTETREQWLARIKQMGRNALVRHFGVVSNVTVSRKS